MRGSAETRAARATRSYWAWLACLGVLIVSGVLAYAQQVSTGLTVTAMRDQVSWGFYIGNFTFLVGVAAAAVILVIPAYVYDWKPIREIVIYGELLAISAIVMCLLFVLVDIGRPDRFWHLIPPWRVPELPAVDPGLGCAGAEYLFPVNFAVATHILYRAFHGQRYVEATGCSAGAALDSDGGGDPYGDGVPVQRPSGAAVLELVDPSATVPGIGVLFRPGDSTGGAAVVAPVHKVRDSGSGHLEDCGTDGVRDVPEPVPARGGGVQRVLLRYGAPAVYEVLVFRVWARTGHWCRYAWSAVALNLAAFALFIVPAARRNWITLNFGCLATYAGVYIEKGMGLIIPGLTPDTLGEIYEYYPTLTELRVAAGIFALGFLLFTLMLKVAVPISLGEFGEKDKQAEHMRPVLAGR